MRKPTFISIAAGLLLGAAALAASGAQRTFVASYGLDTNSCSLPLPCRTFTRALTQTDANGEVLVLDSAGYGTFTITQSVSIIAPEGVYAGISVLPGQHGIVVNNAGINVTLRGLTINGQGGEDGIRIGNAGNIVIENLTIANTGNKLTDAGIRVVPGATISRLLVTDSTVRRNAGVGIWIQASTTLVVDRCRIELNSNGGIIGESPGGRMTVSNSLLEGNGSIGVGVTTTAAGTWDVTVAGSILDGNTFAGVSAGNGTDGIYRIAVTDSVLHRNNSAGVFLAPNLAETMTALVGNNRIVGNAAAGIFCSGGTTGSTTLVAERNAVVGNLRAFEQGLGCTFEVMGNNAARNNVEADVGTITSRTLR